MCDNKFGITSQLSFSTANKSGKTVLDKLSFTAPFKVTKPFYDQQNRMKLMVLSVSAGVMAGDRQEIQIDIGDDSFVTVTSQSYEKIHKMSGDSFGSRQTNIAVGKNATLIYNPLPCIPYKDSAYMASCNIDITESSRLLYSDIITCGRCGLGEYFDFTYYKSQSCIKLGGTPIYYDNSQYFGNCDKQFAFQNYTHLLTAVVIFGTDVQAELKEITASLTEGIAAATMLAPQIYCVKALAKESEPLLKILEEIKKLL